MNAFRLDIQGLRAIAVVAVVLFHLLPKKLSGGFVGVDVFFVISGFLITGIVCRDIAANRFTLANFYARRIRRLFPALITMLLCCSVAVLLIGLPQDIRLFGQSALASVLYISNLFFLTQSGYFDNGQSLNLLLHTWSLSVEEQFYLVLPALLLLFHRFFPNRNWLALSAIGLVSLAACIVLSKLYPSTAFFSSPTRFWQFVAGGLLVLVPQNIYIWKRTLQLGGWAGLLLLIYAFREISEDDSYPGYLALLPTVATVLLILGGFQSDGWLHKLLALRWMQFFGKISYSLYLWHWPVIVCFKLWFSTRIDDSEALQLFLLSTLLAYGSWRFIENPLRHADPAKPLFRATYLPAFLSTLLIGAIALLFVDTDGMKPIFPQDAIRMASYLEQGESHNPVKGPCFREKLPAEGEPALNAGECLPLSATGTKRVLLAGDSHAAQYGPALKSAYPDVLFSQVTAPGCRALLPPKKSPNCTDLMNRLFSDYAPGQPFDSIILAGRWDASEMQKLANAIGFLRQYTARVILLGPIVEYEIALPRLIAREGLSADAGKEISRHSSLHDTRRVDERMRKALEKTGVEYYSVVNALCPEGKCTTVSEQAVPVQFDYGHLTHEGALLVVERIRDQQGLQFH